MHAAEQRQPDDRAFGQCRIGILVVDLRLAGGGIDRLFQSDDDSANSAAALADPHPRVTSLRQPDAARFAGDLSLTGWRGQKCRCDSDDETRSASHETFPEKNRLA